MNRHVIKGRGKNRGKYLGHERANGEPGTGYVWLDQQRKAARFGDPRYCGDTYERRLAAKYNGYWVKLVVAGVDSDAVRDMRGFIAEHAAGAHEPLDCYWFDGDFHEAGEDFCRDCAEKLVDEKYAADRKLFESLYGDDCDTEEERYSAAIDGGFNTEHDSPPYCETCGEKLSGNLTDHGADEEIVALTGDCAPSFDDVEGWGSLDHAIINLSDDDPRWRAIARVVKAAATAESAYKAKLAAIAATPGMPETRAALLSLLEARAVQKAPEPSFRMWEELLAWDRLSRAEKETDKREKNMLAEAKCFASSLGMDWHWSSGMLMIEAPYGTYYWPFVVRIEQYRLWGPKAFLDGRAYMLHPCPSGDSSWPHHRDANPYPNGSDEHHQWDCGYIGAIRHKKAA